ncbi:ROK family transcriptional regulator [Candidatus Clostridium helianthi]|uniref:ROK family transcriptional regulator n=1 Tax=Candidatus Clostridium helianthi TaxID=3381660 RepID=A0ABW8S1X9_9CLOT
MKHIHEIKDKNKKDILRLLYTKQNLSKKRIASELGLSQSVITKICAELIADGIIIESNQIKTQKVGRNEIEIKINPTYKYCFGITINHKKTTILLTDLALNIIKETSFSTILDPQEHISRVISSLRELIADNLLESKYFMGIGISIKGVTDGKYAYHGIWDTVVDMKSPIQQAFNIPVAVDNGVRCSALLEQLHSNEKNFIFLKYMEPGIGGALVRNGKIERGETHSIVDFGHLIINPDGSYCPVCKRRGCLESIISIEQMLNYAKSNFRLDFCPVFWNLCEGLSKNINISNIIKSAEHGSIPFNQIFKRNAKFLALSIINTFSIIDIKKIIIIGDLFSSERFNTYFKAAINELQLTPIYDIIQIHTYSDVMLSPVVLALNEFIFI